MTVGAGPFEEVRGLAVAPPSALHGVQGWLVRQAVKGLLPLRGCWPAVDVRPEPRTGRLSIELVSHCWGYSHLLECQLGSLLANPPADVDLTMTVYFSAEDARTLELLELAAEREAPGLRWCFRELPKGQLFRRSIGRNDAALRTAADWIWFTDCDVLFGPGCLDSLGSQGLPDDSVSNGSFGVTDGTPFVVTGPQGGPFPEGSRTYTLVNFTPGLFRWDLDSPEPWLTSAVLGGALGPMNQTEVTLTLDSEYAASLPVGEYPADIV